MTAKQVPATSIVIPMDPPAQAPMLALHIQLRRDRFEAFQRLAEREVRPVEEVLTSYLADFANLIQQRDFADAFGDELPTAPMTQAMRFAAAAEDERERSLYVDDEAAAYEYYAHAAGYVEHAMALEG